MVKSQIITQGEKLILNCFIDSNPLCQQIRWLYNEKELIIQSCTIPNIAEYIIENIDRSLAGNYTCEVRNLLNTTFENPFDGISYVTTDVRVQCKKFQILKIILLNF
jgi:hypothetical protein